MQTKLGLFCDKVIETGWLAAAIIAPLYFNVISSRIFEPDKITLVRYIALIMILAWLVRLLENAVTADPRSSNAAESGSAVAGLIAWLRSPLIIPTLLLVAIYVVATVFSIVPNLSLWGSYQRLQGTYSTLSYIVIFLLMLQTLRTQAQVERLITTVILTSVPASLYGILQHFDLDPLPWGGDTQIRVASAMGNAIFIGAYLIMVVPLALTRLVDRSSNWVSREVPDAADRPLYVRAGLLLLPTILGTALFMLLFQGLSVYAMSITPTGVSLSPLDWGAILLGAGLVVVVIVLAAWARKFPPAALEGAMYTLVILLQLACTWYTQSRGPQFGLVVGVALFFFLFAIRRRMRVVFTGTLVAGLFLAGLLLFINMENSPLAFLRDVPYVARLARLGDEAAGASGTGTVRLLIWQGAAEMVRDDPVRTLIGYGPEAMHVGYNRFYPPDLAHYEARNASPDRSHNETWDALVFTGVVGLIVYLVLFGAVFYHALDYLGLIVRHPRWLYWLPIVLYGVVVAMMCVAAIAAPSLWVALSGMLIAGLVGLYVVGFGVLGSILEFVKRFLASRRAETAGGYTRRELVYGVLLTIVLLWLYNATCGILGFFLPFPKREESDQKDHTRELILIGLLSALVAHFVEIQFGIAIVSTRTHFWLYAGLLVIVGILMTRKLADVPSPEASPVVAERDQASQRKTRRKRRQADARRRDRGAAQSSRGVSNWWLPLVPAGLVGAIVMTVMVSNVFIPNQSVDPSQEPQFTALRLAILAAWLILTLIEVSRLLARQKERDATRWGLAFLTYSLLVWAGVVVFMLVQRALLEVNASGFTALGTRPDPDSSLMVFYVWLFLALFTVGAGLYLNSRVHPSRFIQGWIALLYPLFAVIVLAASVFLNLNIIRANMWFKQGEYFANQLGAHDRAVGFYKRALEFAPREDWYYLFLGKAYLDLLPQVQDVVQRTELLRESETELLKAQAVNPLNTDHTANLARLHRLGTQNYAKSLEYYKQAVELSPHNAQLFNEMGQTYQLLGQLDQAMQTYQHSLELDPLYINTYVLLGEMYRSQGRITDTLQLYLDAAHTYETSVPFMGPSRVQLYTEIGRVYLDQGRYDEAIAWYDKAIAIDAESLPAHSALGYVYIQQAAVLEKEGNTTEAQALYLKAQGEFERCVEIRPRDFTSQRNLASVYLQLGQTEKAMVAYEACAQIRPQDVSTRQNLAALYLQTGRRAEAIAQYEEILKLAPNDLTALRNLAILYRDAGRISEALAMAQRALQLSPNDAQLQALVTELQGQ